MNKIIIKFIYIIILNDLLIIFPKYNKMTKKSQDKKKLLIEEIAKVYSAFNKVNINEIEEKINNKTYFSSTNIKSIINIGFAFDKNFILEAMLTITSILSTQFKTTRINFHLGVTNDFPAESMVKIYELRYRINNLSEFNFYYLKESVLKMKNFHHKGESLAGRVELPNYISDKIEKLIFFDVGDLLVLRDLTELYNYNMGEFWVLGLPEPWHINSFMIPKYNISKYINTGAMLLNIKMLKKNNFWDNYSKNKNLETIGDKAQTLFNILIPDNKKNYLPFNLGGYCFFQDDNSSDSFNTAYISFHNFFDSNLSLSFPNNPKSTKGILSQMHNPRFIHQFFGKWSKGKGLSIYRILAKYFISLTGISIEFCDKIPGYCI